MSTMYGADADELERLAVEFIRAADELDGEGQALTGILNRVSWLGDIATRYLDNWTGVQIPKIGLSTQFLRDAASQLQAHAKEQRQASGGNGSGNGNVLAGTSAWLARSAQETARQLKIFNELASTLDQMRTASAEEQAAWWNSLSDEQRSALIAFEPVHVLTLAGLADTERQQARDQYVSDISDEIVTSSASVDASLEIDVWVVSGEIEFELEKKTFRDGHVEVTFSADMGVGLNADVAKIMAERGLAGTYTFASEAEYQEFVNGMLLRVADLNLNDTGFEIAAYLAEHSDHFKSVEISAGASIKLETEAPGQFEASFEAGVSVSAEYDRLDGTTTLSAASHVNASTALTPIGIEASGAVEVTGAVTFEDGAPTSVSLSFDYEGSASFDLLGDSSSETGSLGADHSGSAKITFDLTDRVVREQFGEVIAAMKRGDTGAALAAAGQFIDQGEVLIQQFAGATANYEIDAQAAKAEVNLSGSAATSTFVKPPGSSMFALN